MPRYDFKCRECGHTFELSRPMSEASAAAPCPHGHADTVKLLSTFGVTRGGGAPAAAAAPAPASGGGCCGGGCCG
ncbi:zinc ribbon domain-containing protein [Rhodococcus sp. D2-41]|uniref:Zinc ribbon domain-containing protein n=1 Tax=Speluncibacter jeojiensis TaxID=2710754 RepID=A0A9X4M6L3_9ACTN|nr:zinc ribbon domain-containing protein [Rhodococcus sp. D2-41]MDG3009154.1 zinc ribbon domain-containing protein [Rhodococcus sp. D2-41]MDG3016173.1 zinc ribbon domain-containing protein [Corynebacteriales bacterium D3-21]